MQGGFSFRSTAAQGDARNARKTALLFRSRQRTAHHVGVMAWDQAASNGHEHGRRSGDNTCVIRPPNRHPLNKA
jgi:hypothetical protein